MAPAVRGPRRWRFIANGCVACASVLTAAAAVSSTSVAEAMVGGCCTRTPSRDRDCHQGRPTVRCRRARQCGEAGMDVVSRHGHHRACSGFSWAASKWPSGGLEMMADRQFAATVSRTLSADRVAGLFGSGGVHAAGFGQDVFGALSTAAAVGGNTSGHLQVVKGVVAVANGFVDVVFGDPIADADNQAGRLQEASAASLGEMRMHLNTCRECDRAVRRPALPAQWRRQAGADRQRRPAWCTGAMPWCSGTVPWCRNTVPWCRSH